MIIASPWLETDPNNTYWSINQKLTIYTFRNPSNADCYNSADIFNTTTAMPS